MKNGNVAQILLLEEKSWIEVNLPIDAAAEEVRMSQVWCPGRNPNQ